MQLLFQWTRSFLQKSSRQWRKLQSEFKSAFDKYIEETVDPRITPIYNEINGAGNHIKNYGIKLGYASGASKIEASENVTFDIKDDEGNVTSTKSLVFDGWYDVDSGVKITADRMYGNRIIIGQNLVAGYVEADKHSSNIGVSVTKLEQDYYFVDNTNTAKIRFNTGLNVYNAPDDNEGNSNVIQSTAVIYVQLPIDKENGIDTAYWKEQFATTDLSDKLRDNILTNLNTKDSFKNGVSGKTGNITFDDREISWHSANANVEENCDLSNDDVTEYSYGYVNGSDGLKLNNKNRAHYTLNLKLESWETDAAFSAMLVYAAIYSGDQWIMSDNAVDNINATYTPAPVDPDPQ